MTLAIIEHKQPITILPKATQPEQVWFPNLEKAYQDARDSYEALPTASTTERYSQRDFEYRTALFLRFLDDNHIQIPDKRALTLYVGHMQRRGLSPNTTHVYLVYARKICAFLAEQFINPGLPLDQYRFMTEARHAVLTASNFPNPKSVTQKNAGSVYAKGKRLTMEESQVIMDHIDTSDLIGKRDAALMLTGFVTGMRLSELGRITLDSIQEYQPGQFSVTVRAKGGKQEPRAIDRSAVQAIRDYVDAFNALLDKDDPRRIRDNQPVWMPLTRTGRIFNDVRSHLSTRGLSNIITSRSSAPGPEYAIKAHDLRRTWAANAEQLGMKPEDIQEQMLHNTLQQTREYIARPKDITGQNIVAAGFKLELK